MIQLKDILTSDKKILTQIKKVYQSSFPPNERREFKDVVNLLADLRFQIKAILVDDDFAGFISIWDFDTFLYIEHFAIIEELRGNGLGSYVLQKIINDTELKILLEVDIPHDNISFKRIKFYERLGFILNHEDYIQPPYNNGLDPVPMFIMSNPELSDYKEFIQIVKTLYSEVYKSIDTLFLGT